MVPPPTGEQIQKLGEEGAQRAKRWLDSTCRAEVKWNNPEKVQKLQYLKAGASPGSTALGDYFSFDLGGTLLGGDEDGDVFLAECKKYSAPGDQGPEYRDFLANCYRVQSEQGNWCDHFLWITWAPFLVNSWPSLRTAAFIATAINETTDRKYTALGSSALDPVVAGEVAKKVTIVVLSDNQEVLLSLHGDELMHVRKSLLDWRTAS